jgi:uncharacterized membrane-anchored protein YhcB (DUF1043 family)
MISKLISNYEEIYKHLKKTNQLIIVDDSDDDPTSTSQNLEGSLVKVNQKERTLGFSSKKSNDWNWNYWTCKAK